VNATTFKCGYDPKKVGEYIITITFGGQPISKSPFIVDVGPTKASKITAYGPGLDGGVVGQPATFVVETHGETGALGLIYRVFTRSSKHRADIEQTSSN